MSSQKICECDICTSVDCTSISTQISTYIQNTNKMDIFNKISYKSHIGHSLIVFYEHGGDIKQDIRCPYGKKCFIMHINNYHNKMDGCTLQKNSGNTCHFICYKCGGSLQPRNFYKHHAKMIHSDNFYEIEHLKREYINHKRIIEDLQKEIEELKLQIKKMSC